MIDAGSTGSRALAFSFHESIIGGNLILDDELYTETKPGLSAYAENPKEAAKSLTVLLEKVKDVIPRSEWQHTPLSMRATAGLRLLPGHLAQDILQECRKLFEDSGFQVRGRYIREIRGARGYLHCQILVFFSKTSNVKLLACTVLSVFTENKENT